MTKSNTDVLQELVQIARDSKSFYESAAKEVDDTNLKLDFQRMAEIKGELITQLSRHISARGEAPETSGTFAGTLRKGYGELLAHMRGKKGAAKTYTAQLEETEDRLLKHYEEALRDVSSPEVREVLSAQLPKLRQCHDEMKRLKLKLAA
jgi:uncharacterized protein (TIGR02284 family)